MNPYYDVVAKRADYRCEYCRAPEVVFNFPFEVEHILPISRNGKNDEANLALACRSCNLRKGARIHGTLANSTAEIEFFHPRNQLWNQHFQVNADSGKVMGITSVGKVTVASLAINSPAQVIARQLWIRLGLFP